MNNIILPKEKLDKIIEYCDANINLGLEQNSKPNELVFNKMVICLCIKFIMFTGATYDFLKDLRAEHINTNEDTVLLNSFKVRLPKTLGKQIKQYLSLRQNGGALFAHHYDEKENGETIFSGGLGFTKETIIQGVALDDLYKHTIAEFIMAGANSNLIKIFTGINDDILNECVNRLSEEDKEKTINSIIAKPTTYYKL